MYNVLCKCGHTYNLLYFLFFHIFTLFVSAIWSHRWRWHIILQRWWARNFAAASKTDFLKPSGLTPLLFWDVCVSPLAASWSPGPNHSDDSWVNKLKEVEPGGWVVVVEGQRADRLSHRKRFVAGNQRGAVWLRLRVLEARQARPSPGITNRDRQGDERRWWSLL